ncbi:hypothetical protein FRX31_007561 [Thalictrum thalictroides]|uniref:Histidine-containing phosphotransfer protein n=1 Tax=Thalictrum thalictroides TaxID=46969 RepID=A0A7J6X233_THATH|nr:hypothetical protein FRX31_007561 [Thalictrum thalictroides]
MFKLIQQFSDEVKSLQQLLLKGILDRHFDTLQVFQEDYNQPGFMEDVITLFSMTVAETLPKVTMFVSAGMEDQTNMKVAVHRIKGCSGGVGACKVVAAADELLEAMETRDHNRAMHALYAMTNEFYIVRDKLQNLVELDARVYASKQKVLQMMEKSKGTSSKN